MIPQRHHFHAIANNTDVAVLNQSCWRPSSPVLSVRATIVSPGLQLLRGLHKVQLQRSLMGEAPGLLIGIMVLLGRRTVHVVVRTSQSVVVLVGILGRLLARVLLLAVASGILVVLVDLFDGEVATSSDDGEFDETHC